MSTYRCPACDLTFDDEEGGAKLCPLCQGKLRIENDDPPELAENSGRSRLWLGFWIVYLLVGPFLNLIPAALFGVWAIAIAMMICGLLLAKVCEHSEFQSAKQLLLWSIAGLIPPVFTFYLLPGWIISEKLPWLEPGVLWAAGLFFFGMAAFSAAYFRNIIRIPASLGALALAIFFFYAEPKLWFYSIPIDREWSRAVNLSQTKFGLFDSKLAYGHWFAADGKLYWQSQSTLAWNPEAKTWEEAKDAPPPGAVAGQPHALPYEQPFDANQQGTPAKPELVLFLPDPANPGKWETRRYALDLKKLYPTYDPNSTTNVRLSFSPKKVLPDGRLLLAYRLTWQRYNRRGKTAFFSGDQDYLSPGTLMLNLKTGDTEVKAGKPLQNTTIQLAETDQKLLVCFDLSYSPDIHDIEYDYETGEWSDRGTFFRPESTNTLCRSYFLPEGDMLHCLIGNELEHRVRAPLAMLGMEGYGKPGEILYCRRDLKSGEWSKFRKLSPGIKFVEWPEAAKEGATMAVVWRGKQRGDSRPPGEIPHLYYVLSRDGGEHWTPPQEIPLPEPLKVGIPKLAIVKDTLHLFFDAPPLEDRWGGNRRELYHLTRTLPDHKQ